jgi:hypothetical protein
MGRDIRVIGDDYSKEIDWDCVNVAREIERKRSFEYLKKITKITIDESNLTLNHND